MAKKKRFRPRTTGGPSTHGGNRDTGRDSNRGSTGYSSNTPGGGAGRRRPPSSRRRSEYGSTSNDSFPEPALDESGEIALVEFAGVLEMHPNGYGFFA